MTIALQQTGASRRRHIGAFAAVFALVILLLGSVGAGAAVYHRTQDALGAARSERQAALASLDASLATARGGGVGADRLAPITSARVATLAEAAKPARLVVFDGGEVDHLRQEAGGLRSLRQRVGTATSDATSAARRDAQPSIDSLAAAIGDAQTHGVDIGDADAVLAASRTALSTAAFPNAARSAVAALPARTQQLHDAVTKKAADDAAALAHAQLSGAQASAQSALTRADTLLATAKGFPQLQLGSDPATIAAEHQAYTAAVSTADFQAVAQAARGAANDLSSLLGARSSAYSAMSDARSVVSTAISSKVDPGQAGAQLDALQPQLDAAGTAGTFSALRDQINAVVAPIQAALNRVNVGAGKVIVISLANQSLTAYQDGAVVYRTLITTGRPALPTPPGNYSVLSKHSPWHMISEYPPGSIGYYPPSWVQYTLWFRGDGYAIHDAPWRSTYGPGTQQYGSHGCVNVPMPIMASLYSWATVGTQVIVTSS